MKAIGIFSAMILLTVSCKSLPKSEANQEAQMWFDNGFTKCGEDYFSNYYHEVKELGGVYRYLNS